MNPQSCSLEYVFDATDTPVARQLSRQQWNHIHDTAPMLVRNVNGRDSDVRLNKDTLLKYFGTVMTKAQSEASIAQFGPSDMSAGMTMREVS